MASGHRIYRVVLKFELYGRWTPLSRSTKFGALFWGMSGPQMGNLCVPTLV